MALAHLGVVRSQPDIAHALIIRKGFGTPASQIVNLQSHQIEVTYRVDGTPHDLHQWLGQRIPVIAFIQAGELPHWTGIRAQHAVLVSGLDDTTAILHDPALAEGPIAVSIGDFLLAWGEMDYRFAALAMRSG